MSLTKSTGIAAACAAGLFTISAAHADSIGEIKLVEGSAIISQGAQYVPAREGMQLQELDRIMVMEDSSAVLAFVDGCEYTMTDSQMLTLGAESVCAVQAAAPSIETIEKGATSQLATTTAGGAAAAGASGAAGAAGAGILGVSGAAAAGASGAAGAAGAGILGVSGAAIAAGTVVTVGVVAAATDTGSDIRADEQTRPPLSPQ